MPTLQGVYTALLTPWDRDLAIDRDRFDRLLDLQRAGGVGGVVVGGTTAESPTLSPEELELLVVRARERLPGSMEVIAGTGRSDPRVTEALTVRLADRGVTRFLIVDPAYNAPSSAEIRRESLEPLAGRHPELEFVPYVIPGRTGTRLLPVDLELLHRRHPNIVAVKDACGDPTYSREVRRGLPPPFALLSGDDGRTLTMIRDPQIRADGVISVVANLAPATVVAAVAAARDGDAAALARSGPTLEALGRTVTVVATEATPRGPVEVRVRNPVPIKAACDLLGAPVGPCRPPLGRLTPSAFVQLAGALAAIDAQDPEAFRQLRHHLGAPDDGPGGPESRWSYGAY